MSSIVHTRNTYFETLSNLNKLVAHGRVGEDNNVRNSYHRLNSEEELLAACINWAHFPCVVHVGLAGRYTGHQNSLPKRKVINQLWFLQQADPADMDAIAAAKDIAFEVMEEFIAYIYADWKVSGPCGEFSNIDLGRFGFSEVVYNNNLFGWELTFEDEKFATNIDTFDRGKWFGTGF